MKYLYADHMGGYYILDEELSWDSLYCEECGDSDMIIAEGEEKDFLSEIISDVIYDVTTVLNDEDCDWDIERVRSNLPNEMEKITTEDIKKEIVKINKKRIA